MLRLAASLAVVLASTPAFAAGSLKALFVICDAYETDANNAIAESVRVDLATMTRLTHSLEQSQVMPVQRVVLQGRKATTANVWKAISQLEVGPDDTLMFYFSGHGANDHEHSLLYAVDENEIDRARLEKELVAKKARFTLILTDACNSYLDGDSKRRGFMGAQRGARDFPEVWKRLFVAQRGVLHVAAASPGEYAWSDNEEGGSFTHALVDEGLLKEPGATWDAVFDAAKQRTIANFNGFSRQQRAKLKAEGITSQTPKAYRMPTAAPTDVQPTPTTVPQNTPPLNKGQVVLLNSTTGQATFLHDLNAPGSQWSEKQVRTYTLAAKQSQSLPAPARIGWVTEGDSVVKELEAGAYHFDTNDEGLVLVQDGAQSPGGDKKTNKLEAQRLRLVGNWLWEDSDGSVISTLNADGSFKDKSQKGKTVEAGKWDLITEKTLKGKQRTYVAFTSKDKSGDELEYRYRFKFTDDNTVELVLKSTLRQGKVIRRGDDGMDGSVMMYRK